MKTNYFKNLRPVVFLTGLSLVSFGAFAISNSARSIKKKAVAKLTTTIIQSQNEISALPADAYKASLKDNYLAMNEPPQGPIGGIAENSLQPTSFKLYPNPNDERFTVQFNLNTSGELDVRLTDIIGKEVADQKVEGFTGRYSNQFDLSNKEKGLYMLFIVQNHKQLVKKVIVN